MGNRNTKYTLDEIQKRLDDKFGVGLITIAPNQEYLGIRKPMVFIDRDYGAWTTAPFNLLQNGNTHPERSCARRKSTNLEKYGHENAFGNDQIKAKIRQTSRMKYGVDNPSQSVIVKEHIKSTNNDRYGCDYPFVQNEDVIEKVKTTNIERYGVENPAHSEALQKKKRDTCLEKYNANSPLQNDDVKQKIRETNLLRLGVEYPTQSAVVREKVREAFEKYGGHPLRDPEIQERLRQANVERYGMESVRQINSPVMPNGMILSQYLKAHGKDRCLNYTSCRTVFLNYGFDVLQQYVEFGKEFGKNTALEAALAEVLGIETFKKCLKKPFRYPDFRISDSVFLDIDGLYWHSFPIRERGYHFNKRMDYETAGFRLIQFREDELLKKPEIVKSMVDNVLGRNVRVYARKCAIRSVPWSEAKQFLEANHLQGVGAVAICYGLYAEDQLIMLMGVRKNSDAVEISRMCSLINHTVLGGFSKLLAHVEQVYGPKKILSWCDLRYASGLGYEAVGFLRVKDTLGWMWTDFKNTFNRRRCRANMDGRKLPEAVYASELGWSKIYDAGQRLFVKNLE